MNEVQPKPETYAIPGMTITSSKKIVSPATKLAMLLWAPSGMGKTCLAGSLDRLTQKFDGRRVLYIPVEASEGGGAVSIRKLDIPLYIPKDLNDLSKALGSLINDKTFAGVVLDSATETVKQHVKPAALRYPPRENIATRSAGVPTRSDYQVMGELTSQIFRQLLLMTVHEKPEYRKHIVVTATEKSIEEDEKIIWRGPDLPGRMASEAVAMFQISATIKVKTQVVAGKRGVARFLVTSTDGVEALKDRFELFPQESQICKAWGEGEGEDLASLWEKYWLPAMNPNVA
jgi:hypothetical protein